MKFCKQTSNSVTQSSSNISPTNELVAPNDDKTIDNDSLERSEHRPATANFERSTSILKSENRYKMVHIYFRFIKQNP